MKGYRTYLEDSLRDGRSEYAGALDKLDEVGEERFAVTSIDVSTICSILLRPKSWKTVGLIDHDWNVTYAINSFREDRHQFDAHSSRNEDNFDILSNELVTLEHLRRLLRAIRRDTHIQMDDKREFVDSWGLRLAEYHAQLKSRYYDDDNKRHYGRSIVDDVEDALASDSPDLRYWELLNDKYLAARRENKGDLKAERMLKSFMTLAADRGVPTACALLARFYLDEYDQLFTYDCELAAQYLYEARDSLNPEDTVSLANLISDGHLPGHGVDEADELVEACKRREPHSGEFVKQNDGERRWRYKRHLSFPMRSGQALKTRQARDSHDPEERRGNGTV